MDQKFELQSLGGRIVSAARLAAELHLAMDDSGNTEFRQRDSIGGTGHSGRPTRDGCGHAGLLDTHPVTDDTLRFGGR
jgi:hypothetical protein